MAHRESSIIQKGLPVEEVDSLNAKVDMIMSMLSTKDIPNVDNVPIGALVEKNQEQIDVNFIV